MPKFDDKFKEVMNSGPGKLLRAALSVFTLTASIAVKTSAVMAKAVTDIAYIGSSEWVKKVLTGQSFLYNAHGAFFVSLSEFFGKIGDQAIAAGTYGFKYAGEAMRDHLLETLNEGGFGDTASDEMDAEDLAAIKGAKSYEEFANAMKDRKMKGKTDTLEQRMKLGMALQTVAEWLAEGATLVDPDEPLGQTRVEDLTEDQEAEYERRITEWFEKGLQDIDIMVVNGTFLHNKDGQDRIAKTMKEILVTDEATGERKLKPGVGLDRALTVVEALSEELMRPLKKEAAKLEPGNSPAEPYGDAPFLAPGRLVPPVGVC